MGFKGPPLGVFIEREWHSLDFARFLELLVLPTELPATPVTSVDLRLSPIRNCGGHCHGCTATWVLWSFSRKGQGPARPSELERSSHKRILWTDQLYPSALDCNRGWNRPTLCQGSHLSSTRQIKNEPLDPTVELVAPSQMGGSLEASRGLGERAACKSSSLRCSRL